MYTGIPPQETSEWGVISFEKVTPSGNYKYEGSTSTYFYETKYNGSYFVLEECETTSNIHWGIKQGNISVSSLQYPYLFLAELYREQSDMPNLFGGTTDDAIKEKYVDSCR